MKVEVQYVGRKWEITMVARSSPLNGRKVATAEEIMLEDVQLKGGRIFGTAKAVWGLEVFEGATVSLRDLGVGGRFGKPSAYALQYADELNAYVDSATREVVTRTPQLRLKGRSMRYWR